MSHLHVLSLGPPLPSLAFALRTSSSFGVSAASPRRLAQAILFDRFAHYFDLDTNKY